MRLDFFNLYGRAYPLHLFISRKSRHVLWKNSSSLILFSLCETTFLDCFRYDCLLRATSLKSPPRCFETLHTTFQISDECPAQQTGKKKSITRTCIGVNHCWWLRFIPSQHKIIQFPSENHSITFIRNKRQHSFHLKPKLFFKPEFVKTISSWYSKIVYSLIRHSFVLILHTIKIL